MDAGVATVEAAEAKDADDCSPFSGDREVDIGARELRRVSLITVCSLIDAVPNAAPSII